MRVNYFFLASLPITPALIHTTFILKYEIGRWVIIKKTLGAVEQLFSTHRSVIFFSKVIIFLSQNKHLKTFLNVLIEKNSFRNPKDLLRQKYTFHFILTLAKLKLYAILRDLNEILMLFYVGKTTGF